MRRSFVGALLGASLVIVVAAGRGSSEPAYTPIDSPVHSNASELITHVTATEGQPIAITVIDPRQKVMAVYYVDRASGEITPKSVLKCNCDLQMVEFNSCMTLAVPFT